MHTLFRLGLLFCFSLSLISCRTRAYRAESGQFLIAQQSPVAPENRQLHAHNLREDIPVISTKKIGNKAPLLTRAKQAVVKKVEKAVHIKKQSERIITNRLTTAKELKKSNNFRLADLLFFVILAVLLSVALILLKQLGYSSDAIIFIAMGAAVVIALLYIYFHTWMFTA